jgi:hypothetical protein
MAHRKDENGLTPLQKAFATLLATRPGEPEYKLAEEAGVPHKGAAVWASRTARLPTVQAYYQKLTSAAVKSLRKERGDIANLAEVLAFHTATMRGKLGRYVKEDGSVDVERVRKAPGGAIKKYRSRTQKYGGEDGPIVETTAEIELADSQAAANALLGHFSKTAGLDRPTFNLNVFQALPAETRVSVIKAFLSAPAE